jgi:hypothetical protein
MAGQNRYLRWDGALFQGFSVYYLLRIGVSKLPPRGLDAQVHPLIYINRLRGHIYHILINNDHLTVYLYGLCVELVEI